ncbi:hypothetical protein Tco_1376241 [Tanacetum coccineum]
MGDVNPIRTLGDYSKPSHEGYRNTIELSIGNNVVHLRSDTIRLVQNRCLFHGYQSEDSNQHLKDFLKLVDLMRYFSFGRHLDELHVTWAHLEKKRTRLQTNTKTLEDLCSQSLETASQAIHDAVTTHQVLENQLLSASLLICLGKRDCVERIPSADGNLRELSGEEAWETIENFAQGQKESDNPPNIISEQEIENLKVQAKRLFGNENIWVEMHRNIAWDKVENPNPQNTPQVPPSFKEATLPVTHPEEVDETIGTPIEVEPLNETKLEEVGLNCNHNTPLSSREFHSFDGPEPQPLLNSPSLDMANSYPKGVYSYYNPGINDPKRYYGFKPGEELSLFDRPNEVERGRILDAHRLEPILQQQISQRMDPSHHDDCGDGVTINMRRRHHDTCDGVTTTLTASNAQVIFYEKKLGSS